MALAIKVDSHPEQKRKGRTVIMPPFLTTMHEPEGRMRNPLKQASQIRPWTNSRQFPKSVTCHVRLVPFFQVVETFLLPFLVPYKWFEQVIVSKRDCPHLYSPYILCPSRVSPSVSSPSLPSLQVFGLVALPAFHPISTSPFPTYMT